MDTQILPPEDIQILFSNLDEMLRIHSQFNNLLKVKRRDSPVVGDMAEVLLSLVSVSAAYMHAHVCVCMCAFFIFL